MLKIYVRIHSVDMHGFNGREFHPRPEMVGQFVRITSMETVPEADDDNGGPTAGMFAHPACQFFHGILVDANGEDVVGGEIDLVDHEIESQDDIPVLFGELLA